MAVRTIRTVGDDVLKKHCREVTEMTPKIRELIGDMLETMYAHEGVGLAAPQVGILKRLHVVDVGEGPHVFINPEITWSEGEERGPEGCLSLPGKVGAVCRPERIKVKALDENMEEFELEAEGLFARAICHETDHLDGVLYVDRIDGKLFDVEELEEMAKQAEMEEMAKQAEMEEMEEMAGQAESGGQE